MIKVKKIGCLILLVVISFSAFGQEGKRPELSKSELKKYDKSIGKFNESIRTQTQKLKELLSFHRDSLQGNRFESKLDSLTRLQLSAPDSLKSKIESQLQKLEQLQNKLNFNDSTGFTNGLRQKVANLREELKIGQQLSKADGKVSDKLGNSFVDLGELDLNIKELDGLKSSFESLELDLSKLSELFSPIEANLNDFDKQVSQYTSKLDQYKKDLSQWDKILESRIKHLEAGKLISEHKDKMFDPSAQITNVQSQMEGVQGKDFVQGKMKERFSKLLEEEGPEVLSKRLTEGHEKLGEYKKKLGSLKDLKNAPEKQPNPLKGKPLGERLVLGGNLQINRDEPATLDAGLEIAYRITPKSEWGFGASTRIKLEKSLFVNVPTETLNLRSFYYYRLLRALGFQANYELNRAAPRTAQPIDGLPKQWIQSCLIGIRKEQQFFKGLGGYATIQYDFLRLPESPNPKFIFRFGFRLN